MFLIKKSIYLIHKKILLKAYNFKKFALLKFR